MRKVLTLSSLAVLVAASSAANAGVRYVAADNSRESAICVSAAVDRPMAFESKLEKVGFTYKLVANKLECNGTDIGSFSAAAGNLKTANRLARHYWGKGDVEIREASAMNAALTGAAQSGDIVIMVKGE